MNELVALRWKYDRMLTLRVSPPNDPRPELRELAARFPGALREADDLPLEVIEARVEALKRAALDHTHVEPWMPVTARFHELARGALSAKRWLGGRPKVDDERRAAFEEAHRDSDAMGWSDSLEELAAPPRGRISLAVFERLAAEQGLSVEETRRLVQPHARVRS